MMVVMEGVDPSDSRRRMIRSAAILLRRNGYSGTGFREVIAHSGAPRGSIYHYFPRGKAQLAAEAVQEAGEFGRLALERAVADGGPASALRAFADFWRAELLRGDFRDGCPVVAVAVEQHDGSPEPLRAAALVFESWEDVLAGALREAGVAPARAAALATTVIAAVEGAIVLCRVRRGTEPLDRVIAELDGLVRAAVAG